MKVKELKVRSIRGATQSVFRAHAFWNDFKLALHDSRPVDAIVIALYDSDLSPVHQIRAVMPNMPIVIVADAQTDFGDDRICSKLSNAAMVLSPINDVRYSHVVGALYAAVPNSITF